MQRVVSLQLEAFWQHHSGKLLAVGGVLLVYMLWRTFFGMAKVFINLSDTVAASGFMVRCRGCVSDVQRLCVWRRREGLLHNHCGHASQVGAASCVVLLFLYLRRYYSINPDTVYLRAMARLNTNPGVLEVHRRCRLFRQTLCL